MSIFDGFVDFLKDIRLEGDDVAFGPVLVSATSLLISVMDADGERLPEEKQALRHLLKTHYKVNEDKIDSLFEAGEKKDRDSVDFYSPAKVLQKELTREEKTAFVEMMWHIVYADGLRREVEDHVLNRIAELIGIERQVQIALRHHVEATLNAQ